MTTITNAKALEIINAFANDVPAEWAEDFAAVTAYFSSNPEKTMTHRTTEQDLAALVEMNSSKKIDWELSRVILDNCFPL